MISANIEKANMNGPQIGASTQIHGQSIVPNNFKVMNTIAKSPKNPIPSFVVLLFIFIQRREWDLNPRDFLRPTV